MVSSTMMDFSIRSNLNGVSEETEDEISLNLLDSMLTLHLSARTFKYIFHLKEVYKLEAPRNKMKSLGTILKKSK